MLSYQHAYHAGNAADLHKHIVLADLLALLTVKDRGISYAETHAGRGLYDLASPEAAKTGEAAAGIGRIDPAAESPFARALMAVRRRHGGSAYPGSPCIAAELLRPQDRIVLMELHPAEHAALRNSLAGEAAAIHRRDGREGVLALAPMTPRKGLVLVDPSYEVKSEYSETAAFVRRLVAKWPEAVVMVWYPLLPAGLHAELLAGIEPLPVLVDEVAFEPPPSRGMFGSGLVLVNAPFGTGFAGAHELARAVLQPLSRAPAGTRG